MNTKPTFPPVPPGERAVAPIITIHPHDRRLISRLPSDIAAMLPGEAKYEIAMAMGKAARAFDAIVPGHDAAGHLVALLAGIPAYHAALKHGIAPCALCGDPADPSDEKAGLVVLCAHASVEAALRPDEIDDARSLACRSCRAAGGDEALLAAHMRKLAARGAEMISSQPVGPPEPEANLPRAERRRREKAAKKRASNPAMASILDAAKGVPTGVLYRPVLHHDWGEVATPGIARRIPPSCMMCGANPAPGRAVATLMQVDMLRRPVRRPDGTSWAPIFRICPTCETLPPDDLVNAMLDHPDLRGLGLRAVGL